MTKSSSNAREIVSQNVCEPLRLGNEVVSTAHPTSAEMERDLPSMTFLASGLVSLLAWNAILTSSPYVDSQVFSGRSWPFWAANSYSIGINLGQLLMLKGPVPALSFSTRWTLGIFGMTLFPLGIMIFALGCVQGWMHCFVSFVCAIICTAAFSVCSAIYQGSIYGFAGAAHPKLSASIMAGQGVSGVVAGAAALFPPNMATFISLIVVCCVVTAAAQVLYLWQLRDHQIVKPILENIAADRRRISVDAFAKGSRPSSPTTGLNGELGAMSPQSPVQELVAFGISPRRSHRKISSDVAPQAFGVFFVFAVTFVVFPGVVDQWGGAFGMEKTQFLTLIVGEFQLCDVLGRTMAGHFGNADGKVVIGSSLVRAIFVPLFIAVQRFEGTDSIFCTGSMKVALMFLFAFTNGFVGTLHMMLGPQSVTIKEEKETAGLIMSFALVFGILVGSLLGLITQIGV